MAPERLLDGLTGKFPQHENGFMESLAPDPELGWCQPQIMPLPVSWQPPWLSVSISVEIWSLAMPPSQEDAKLIIPNVRAGTLGSSGYQKRHFSPGESTQDPGKNQFEAV